jgi:hypothetical protein
MPSYVYVVMGMQREPNRSEFLLKSISLTVSTRPEQRIEYIDQIFYSDSSGTLLHQAIESGDRNMFKLLLNAFGADPALPVPWIGSDHGRIGQINVYNLLALTDHCDIWFAYVSMSAEVFRYMLY